MISVLSISVHGRNTATHLQHPDTTQNLIHECYSLVSRLHQVILSTHNNRPSKVIQRQKQASNRQPEEARYSKQVIQEERSNDNLDGGVDESEQMPREFGDAIDVGRHEGHNLRFARELFTIVLLLRFTFSVGCRIDGCGGVLIGSTRCGAGRRCNVLSNESLREQNRVELYAKANLKSSRGS